MGDGDGGDGGDGGLGGIGDGGLGNDPGSSDTGTSDTGTSTSSSLGIGSDATSASETAAQAQSAQDAADDAAADAEDTATTTTGENIGQSALSAQADAQAAMSALGYGEFGSNLGMEGIGLGLSALSTQEDTQDAITSLATELGIDVTVPEETNPTLAKTQEEKNLETLQALVAKNPTLTMEYTDPAKAELAKSQQLPAITVTEPTAKAPTGVIGAATGQGPGSIAGAQNAPATTATMGGVATMGGDFGSGFTSPGGPYGGYSSVPGEGSSIAVGAGGGGLGTTFGTGGGTGAGGQIGNPNQIGIDPTAAVAVEAQQRGLTLAPPTGYPKAPPVQLPNPFALSPNFNNNPQTVVAQPTEPTTQTQLPTIPVTMDPNIVAPPTQTSRGTSKGDVAVPQNIPPTTVQTVPITPTPIPTQKELDKAKADLAKDLKERAERAEKAKEAPKEVVPLPKERPEIAKEEPKEVVPLPKERPEIVKEEPKEVEKPFELTKEQKADIEKAEKQLAEKAKEPTLLDRLGIPATIDRGTLGTNVTGFEAGSNLGTVSGGGLDTGTTGRLIDTTATGTTAADTTAATTTATETTATTSAAVQAVAAKTGTSTRVVAALDSLYRMPTHMYNPGTAQLKTSQTYGRPDPLRIAV